ncbi:nitroreductase family protein [Candidatus Poribacteria bacterium]|nr:nitroreductase family protein [Candidatus Poribacteria bacterium]
MDMTVEEAIKKRRSVRRFQKKPVPRELLMELLDMARWAPCASECCRFVVVQDEERKKQLASAARQEWVASAPVVVVVGADLMERPEIAGRWDAYKFRNIFPIQDTAAAIQNLMLAAVSHGLGTCWIGSFNEGEVARIVHFPLAVRPVAMVTIGYPADEPKARRRRPLEEVVFWETFK